jgi:TRAP-type C4-dicarboxylate transport system substrate-binding protein
MRLTRRTLLTSAIGSLAAPAARLARAEPSQLTLKLHHAFSAVSAPHEKFLAPWARNVEAVSDGRIRIELFPSMQLGGAPAQLLDQARDGSADIVWAAPTTQPGRFANLEVFELPFLLSRRALVSSKAIQDFAATNLQEEFREVRPLCFSCRDPGVLHTGRAINTLNDLKGLKLHAPSRLAAETVGSLGAYGITMPTPQVPMALAARAIDGCLDPWDAVAGLRLNDVLTHHTDFIDAALSTVPFVLAMNRAAYERLPRDLRTVIDDHAGQAAAGMAGAMWDFEAKAVADAARVRGHSITVIGADEVARWRKRTEPVIAAWQNQMKGHKLDGGKLVAAVRDLLAKYADEPEVEPARSSAASRPARPAEQKIVTQPSPPQQPTQTRTEAPMPPKPEAPAVDAAARLRAAPSNATSPAPAAATKLKELDIPL